jgi:hypothetical protein
LIIVEDGITIPEVGTTVSLSDQIMTLTWLPTTLTLASGSDVVISAFDTTNSSINIDGTTYTLSLNAGAIPINIKNLDIDTWIWKLTYIHPLTLAEATVDIKSEDLEKMLTDVLGTWSFSQDWTTEDWTAFVLEVK